MDRSGCTKYASDIPILVQAIVPAGGKRSGECVELSKSRSLPRISFPPDVPAGLKALAGLGTIELTWDRVAENGAVYRLYRSVDGGEMMRIGDALDVPSYTDRKSLWKALLICGFRGRSTRKPRARSPRRQASWPHAHVT